MEVLRCKDCKYWLAETVDLIDNYEFRKLCREFPITSTGIGECRCDFWKILDKPIHTREVVLVERHETYENDYCSHGERRDRMSRYIEKVLFLERCAKLFGEGADSAIQTYIDHIAHECAVYDVEKIVRCKDCAFGKVDTEGSGCVECKNRDAPWRKYADEFVMSPNDFCSYGERKG